MARDEKVILGYTVVRYRGEPPYHDHIVILDPAGVEMAMGFGLRSAIREWPIDTSDRELMFVIQGIMVGRWIAAEQMKEAFRRAADSGVSDVRMGNQDSSMLAYFADRERRESDIRRRIRRQELGLPETEEES